LIPSALSVRAVGGVVRCCRVVGHLADSVSACCLMFAWSSVSTMTGMALALRSRIHENRWVPWAKPIAPLTRSIHPERVRRIVSNSAILLVTCAITLATPAACAESKKPGEGPNMPNRSREAARLNFAGYRWAFRPRPLSRGPPAIGRNHTEPRGAVEFPARRFTMKQQTIIAVCAAPVDWASSRFSRKSDHAAASLDVIARRATSQRSSRRLCNAHLNPPLARRSLGD
jgi:hypothetical protein